jgi:hypothetical protein
MIWVGRLLSRALIGIKQIKDETACSLVIRLCALVPPRRTGSSCSCLHTESGHSSWAQTGEKAALTCVLCRRPMLYQLQRLFRLEVARHGEVGERMEWKWAWSIRSVCTGVCLERPSNAADHLWMAEMRFVYIPTQRSRAQLRSARLGWVWIRCSQIILYSWKRTFFAGLVWRRKAERRRKESRFHETRLFHVVQCFPNFLAPRPNF